MNKTQRFAVIAIIAAGICSASCSNEDSVSYSKTVLTNTELKTILTNKGYTFNEQGNLELNDFANNTTTLDLSGTKLPDLSGLNIFPNLKEVKLSNNGYGPIFDFSKLPSQITGVDLTGNEIYDFEGLVNVTIKNDERQTTILHTFTKLYLPVTAKYNIEDLMPYYEKAGSSTDMQMQNASGTLEKYTTLREIPDKYFLKFLKSKFASLFPNDGNQMDISKQMALKEQGEHVMMGYMTPYEDIDKVLSVEGVEYFINNPFYKPFIVALNCSNACNISYLTPRNNIKAVILKNAATPAGIDFSKATALSHLQLSNNSGVTMLNLSNTLIANQEIKDFDVLVKNGLSINHCKNLKEIQFPLSNKGYLSILNLADLPALTSLDISFIAGISDLSLLQLNNCKITYPIEKLKYSFDGETLSELSKSDCIYFSVSKDVFDMKSTTEFISKFKTYMEDSYSDYEEFEGYRWK